MSTYANSPQEKSAQLKTDSFSKKQSNTSSSFQLMDARPEASLHNDLQTAANNNAESSGIAQLQQAADSSPSAIIQPKENNTGLPDDLKSGIENLSGYSMDDVRVHHNSDKPAGLEAHAYAQGSDIHVAPGQEKHLPHEAWHVVQQKQGRVQPTMQMKGKVAINDDKGLESEADAMGAKALQMKEQTVSEGKESQISENMPVQRAYNEGAYRLSTGTSRKIFVEGGDFASALPAANPKAARAVIHETMVRESSGEKLATRFKTETANYRNQIGLSVSVNDNYSDDKQIVAKKSKLSATAAKMKKNNPGINVVSVLWQDGREDPTDGKIRSEVPFAELRMNAASDPGSDAMFAHLQTQANNVWRKMGDDDMPFPNPNADSEINTKLGELEANNSKTGDMVSFSYNLIPDSSDNAKIREICSYIYQYEAETIEEVKESFEIRVYAIEPTTYYKASGGKDAGKEWDNYEGQSDPHNKQIKEGASFAKEMTKKHGTEPEYVALNVSMPTSDGGRLKDVVAILKKYHKESMAPKDRNKVINYETLKTELSVALKAVDQSIWDEESLTRGSRWMYENKAQKEKIDEIEPQINAKIRKEFDKLLKGIALRMSIANE